MPVHLACSSSFNTCRKPQTFSLLDAIISLPLGLVSLEPCLVFCCKDHAGLEYAAYPPCSSHSTSTRTVYEVPKKEHDDTH